MSKYAPYLQYVIDNILKTPVAELAEHIGVTSDALKKQITLWRQSGIAVPGKKLRKVGEVTMRKDRNRTYQWVKTKQGWVRTHVDITRRVSSTNRRPQKKESSHQPRNSVTVNYNKLVQQPKRLINRVDDLSKKVPLFIPELRLTVYMLPGANAEEIRAKYLSRKAI